MNEHTQKSHLVEMSIIIETFHTNFSLIETFCLSLNETEICMKSLNVCSFRPNETFEYTHSHFKFHSGSLFRIIGYTEPECLEDSGIEEGANISLIVT